MFNKILVVCIGNICRSPVAAAMLKQRFPSKDISSAGLGAKANQPVYSIAERLATADGLDVSDHKSCQIEDRMMHQADLILVMTREQRQYIQERTPEVSGKTMLFGQWLGDSENKNQGIEIPDPYGKGLEEFEHVHKLLVQAANSWQKKFRE